MRLQNNLTQSQLATQLNIGKTAIANYEKGYRIPKQTLLFELAKLFEIELNYFFPQTSKKLKFEYKIKPHYDLTAEEYATYNAKKRVSLAVVGRVSAGDGYWQEDDYNFLVDFYVDDIPKIFDTIAIVVGHSMGPKIKNGDFLFIKKTNQVELNTIGIFRVDGQNYVKKLKSNRLESLNKDYDDVKLNENSEFKTIGTVLSVYRE